MLSHCSLCDVPVCWLEPSVTCTEQRRWGSEKKTLERRLSTSQPTSQLNMYPVRSFFWWVYSLLNSKVKRGQQFCVKTSERHRPELSRNEERRKEGWRV
eukprot:1181117-Prorocentrum_minimum.AAC.1